MSPLLFVLPFTGRCQGIFTVWGSIQLSSTFLASTHVHFAFMVNILQVGLPNHPLSEPTFGLIPFTGRCQGLFTIRGIYIVLNCLANSAHFWSELMYTLS